MNFNSSDNGGFRETEHVFYCSGLYKNKKKMLLQLSKL